MSETFAKKTLTDDGFSLEDFRDGLRQIKKLCSRQSILKMPRRHAAANVD
ncbi:MAG TPA: hypothetical protein VGU25_04680 [Acidobacteriaceae bacterium]|nr:hypothetical protein [Acidobacteriaceae bacterium]